MSLSRGWLGALVVGLFVTHACVMTKERPTESEVTRAIVGPEGGVLSGQGVTLTIPPGALVEARELSLATSSDEAPTAAISPVFRFEPDGLEFELPVHVSVNVSDDAVGTLYWSKPGDIAGFEPAGLAGGGVAEGFTTHFSEAYVGAGVCGDEAPSADAGGTCSCVATEEPFDGLCKTQPPNTSTPCQDFAYPGDEGQGCSGYALRSEVIVWCACKSSEGDYLCPEAYELGPQQKCPAEHGLNGFVGGQNGGGCSGSTIETDPETLEPKNVSKSGSLEDCMPWNEPAKWKSESGTLKSCSIAGGADDAEGASCPVDDPLAPKWKSECEEYLSKAGAACPAPPTPAVLGTKVGDYLEKQLFQSPSGTSTPPIQLTQVVVPYGNKKKCDTVDTENPSSGRMDLVRITAITDTTVTIEIAEIKPMTKTGLSAGVHDIFKCYKDRVIEGGKRCASPDFSSLTSPEQEFCNALQAQGKTVVLADHVGLSWEPGSMTVPISGYDTQKDLWVTTCTPGVVAYRCPDAADGGT
jgi:hypothetical protein